MLTNQLTKEQYDQMASEISGASESLWEGAELQDCYDAVQLENLWPILDKFLKGKGYAINTSGKTEDPEKGAL